MAKYIFQLRRGRKDDERNDWEALATDETVPEKFRIPQDGELVLEYDYGVPRLKIGDGTSSFGALPYMSVDSFLFSKVAKITLVGGDAWAPVEGFENRYTQDITNQIKDKITTHSKIDIQPTPEQLCAFHEKDVAFTTVNENGEVRVCAIGVRPEGTYEDINVTISEVAEEGLVIGDTTATPTPCSDWEQTEETKADYIKNKPTLGKLSAKDIAEKTDLADDVQTSLGKADTALQSEADPTVPSWAKATTKPSYNLDEVSDTTNYVRMTPAERTKLSGVEDNANNYKHPQTHAASMITGLADVATSGSYNDLIDKPTGLATEDYVDQKVADLVDSSPETLNTLNELAAALGDDPNFATTIAEEIGKRVEKVDGKGLSTNDFTDEYKEKIDGISGKDEDGEVYIKVGETVIYEDALKAILDLLDTSGQEVYI